MTSDTLPKHAKLARPSAGRFGRNEWAILGAPCGVVEALAAELFAGLSGRFACAWLDADHAAADTPPGMLAAGALLDWTEAGDTHRLLASGKPGPQQFRALFNDADLVLVNGNHHAASRQIVIIDPAREASLRKRREQLTDIRLILLADPSVPVFDFIEELLPDPAAVPRLRLDDRAGILHFLEKNMAIPPLYGLVLAGGHSRRMGRDKGEICWHGRPQREHLAELLGKRCEKVFLSVRPDQGLASNWPLLPDTFTELGPMGAILSAFRAHPDAAWLVAACDLPLLDEATLDFLIKNRRPGAFATSFKSPEDGWPEPLVAIWEPKSYARALSFLAQGYSCPRKVLINSDVCTLDAPSPEALSNVNTPHELEQLRHLFKLPL